MENRPLCSNGDGREVHTFKSGLCRACYARQWRRSRPDYVQRGTVPSTAPCSYTVAHLRVTHWRGKASQYACEQQCGKTADEWAYIHDSPNEITEVRTQINRGNVLTFVARWSPVIDDYRPLCKPCHIEYDKTGGTE